MDVNQYYNSTVGWLSSNGIHPYCLGEYTFNGPRPAGENFSLDNYLTDPSYSIDIEITNNDTIDLLQGIPDLVIIINGFDYRLSDFCPDAHNYYSIGPEDSVTLTATIVTQNVGGGYIQDFGINTNFFMGTENFSIRVISPDIFTGWMQRYDYGDVKEYDSNSGSWETY